MNAKPAFHVPDRTFIALTLLVLLLIPLYIHLTYHYFPASDCLRHAAKAVSGKTWGEVLVLRDGMDLDVHLGWHSTLSGLHALFGWSPATLVVVSYVALFWVAVLVPALLFRRPEAWVVALLGAALAFPDSFLFRMSRARPFLITLTILVVLLKLWAPGRAGRRLLALTVALIALNTWIHHAWYLWAIPLAAFLLCGRFRDGGRFAACAGLGVLLGALATGHPLQYLYQHVSLLFTTFGTGSEWDVLVGEFKPFQGGFAYLLAVGVLLEVYARLTGRRALEPAHRLLLAVAALGWVGGLRIFRFWAEWGLPALLVLSALLVEELVDRPSLKPLPRRLWVTFLPVLAFFVFATSDWMGQWSRESSPNHALGYVNPNVSRWNVLTPGMAEWLPGDGGIVYSAEMSVFNKMFFDNPHGNWRYVYGYESGMMPDDDLRVLRKIQRDRKDWPAFEPWVRKMGPRDRLVVFAPSTPPIPGMIWNQTDPGVWFGKRSPGPAAAAP